MKQSDLGKIQIIIAIVVAIYVVLPDLFIDQLTMLRLQRLLESQKQFWVLFEQYQILQTQDMNT